MTIDITEFEAGMNTPGRPAGRTRRPADATLGIDFDKQEATFDAMPGEKPSEALERLVREMWGDVDAPTLSILDVTEVTFWGDPDKPSKRFRAKINRAGQTAVDIEALQDLVRKRKPRKTSQVLNERTLIVQFADPQLGKASKGVGSAQAAELWIDKIGRVEDRVRDLRKLGRPVSRILVAGLGDTTEGCLGNYASQLFTTDLNESQQLELGTSLLDRAIDAWSGKVSELWSTTVSSNHDAKRLGKDYPTGRSDCRAFTIWRSLSRAYSKNDERYGHVRFWLPDDPDVATVDLHGVGVAMIHGDLAGKGSSPQAKMWNWWAGQSMGRLPAGDCDVLLSAHYHHHWHVRQCDKDMFGSAALDVVGSQWLTDGSGVWSSPGLSTVVVDASGVSDVEVL